MNDRLKALQKKINKKAGFDASFSLSKENPTDVKRWIPTGSKWLDKIIVRGKEGGIPAGKIVELAGEPSAGKSYLAVQMAINAKKMGFDIVYFDSESALDSDFLVRMGMELDDLLYVQASSVEFVLETIEDFLAENPTPMLFIWDSLSMTACEADIKGNFDPQSSVAMKPRILSKGFKKLVIPMANHGSTFLVVNQLYTNIPMSSFDRTACMVEPFKAHGGKAIRHAYSLAIWLTFRKGKTAFVLGSDGTKIGSSVKAEIKKSRFGTLGRTAEFKILWAGSEISVQDEESWLTVVKMSDRLVLKGAWYTYTMKNGKTVKFQGPSWLNKLQDPEFKADVMDTMDEVLIHNFTGIEKNDENDPNQENAEDTGIGSEASETE